MNLTKLLLFALILAVIFSCIAARPNPRKRKKGKRTKKKKKLPPPPTTLAPPRGTPTAITDLADDFDQILEGLVCTQFEMLNGI